MEKCEIDFIFESALEFLNYAQMVAIPIRSYGIDESTRSSMLSETRTEGSAGKSYNEKEAQIKSDATVRRLC